ncbi:MAG: hypothetical protein F6K21_12415 [Symploca sp. SIO2D2]|nr:hypothetical protein [Symploca sp. SIO2D2]
MWEIFGYLVEHILLGFTAFDPTYSFRCVAPVGIVNNLKQLRDDSQIRVKWDKLSLNPPLRWGQFGSM